MNDRAALRGIGGICAATIGILLALHGILGRIFASNWVSWLLPVVMIGLAATGLNAVIEAFMDD